MILYAALLIGDFSDVHIVSAVALIVTAAPSLPIFNLLCSPAYTSLPAPIAVIRFATVTSALTPGRTN